MIIKHQRTAFLGRNGYFKSTGVSIYKDDSTVWFDASPETKPVPRIILEPITSRGVTGRCCIEIPLEAIPKFIKALKKEAGIRRKI
jgi:hypothetical protein